MLNLTAKQTKINSCFTSEMFNCKSALDKNKIKLLFSCLNAQHQVNKDELSKS